MVDNKTADDKVADNQPAKKDSAADSATVKKETTAKKPENVAAKPAAGTTAAKKESTAKKPENASAKATAKPAAGAASKTGTVTKTGAAVKTKPVAAKISAADKKAADDAIKSKQNKSKKSIDDLKARAHEAKLQAKLRAQKKILDKSYVSDPPDDPLERLANTFDNSARRWEMVVYPSLFAFVLLAGYGFFLIYRLTHDIAVLSQSVTHMAVIVSDAMPRMTKDLTAMTGSMDNMTGDIGGMTTEIISMSDQMDSLTPMSNNIQSMTHNIGSMNRSVYGMQRDMHGMNRTVSSGPLGMMNDAMPFSSNTNVPPQMAPPPVWPAYGNAARQRPYAQPRVAPMKPAVPQKNVKTEVTMPGASSVLLKDLSSTGPSSIKPSAEGQ